MHLSAVAGAKADQLTADVRDRFKAEGFKYFGRVGIETAAGPLSDEPIQPEVQAK
jgi:hypothetical protein